MDFRFNEIGKFYMDKTLRNCENYLLIEEIFSQVWKNSFGVTDGAD
jgi:hypothetical protein